MSKNQFLKKLTPCILRLQLSEIRYPEEETRGKHYCVCHGNQLGFMIQCAGCDEWLHAVCMGLRRDMLEDDSIFRCARCSKFSSKFNIQGPELERPSLAWPIKQGRGEARRISIVPLSPMRAVLAEGGDVDRPADYAPSGGQVETSVLPPFEPAFLRLAPSSTRDYVLILANRRVPVWDHNSRKLIGGALAPTVGVFTSSLFSGFLRFVWGVLH